MGRSSDCAKNPPAKMRGPRLPAGEVGWGKRLTSVTLVIWRRLAVTAITFTPTPPRQPAQRVGGGMKASPDNLHVISFAESETVDCDARHRAALAKGPTSRICDHYAPMARSYSARDGLVARITVVTWIGIHAAPRRVHCGLPAQALLFSHSGGGLQH